MVKLNETKSKEKLLMRDLKDGQIAIVVDDNYPDYKGRIVQRYKDYGVPIGKRGGHGWTSVNNNTLKVRLLKDGETLTIFDNE
jgi:hypothetical protein